MFHHATSSFCDIKTEPSFCNVTANMAPYDVKKIVKYDLIGSRIIIFQDS